MKEYGATPPPDMNDAFTPAATRLTMLVSVCAVSPLGPPPFGAMLRGAPPEVAAAVATVRG